MKNDFLSPFNHTNHRTLTIGGKITECMVSNLTILDLTNAENMLLFVCGEAVETNLVKLKTSHTTVYDYFAFRKVSVLCTSYNLLQSLIP